MPRPESAARGSPRASRIARVAAFALAVLACLPGAGASAAAEPTFDDVTLRGFTTLERVFDATADLAGKGGEYGARVRGQLCILVDPEVGLFSELGSIEGASRRLFARLGGGTSVHVRAYGAPAASAARDESELRRLLEARVGSVSDPIDVLAEVRRTIALMEEAATPKTLLLIGRRGVSGAAKIAETIAAARAASVRVVVAAPEAIFALPPQDTMNAGILYPRAAPPRGGAIFCESQVPEHAVLTRENLAGVFVYEPAWEFPDHDFSKLDLPLPPAPASRPPLDGAEPVLVRVEMGFSLSRFRDWPDDCDSGIPASGNGPQVSERPRLRGLEDSGFPPIPAGFGFWSLTRLAAATGGKYLVTSLSKSKCPFRATYDPRRLGEIQPSLGPADAAGVSSAEREILLSLWREMARCGLALHRPEFGPEGGFAGSSAHNPRFRHGGSYKNQAGCESEARGRERWAADVANVLARVAGLQRADDADQGRMSPRMRATVDLLHSNLARARFHLLDRVACLRRGAPAVFAQGRGAYLEYRSRLVRFWEGIEAAQARVPHALAELPEGLHAPFREAFDSTCSVIRKWEGTPYGATARSAALWRMQLCVPSGFEYQNGEFEDPTGKPPGEIPGTPSSGGGGTDTPR